VRGRAERLLEGLPKGERVPWRTALTVVAAIADALERCESLAIFPGALQPREIVLEPTPVMLASPLVHAMLGEPQHVAAPTAPPRWTPPEQIAGAPWDKVANRYVLGLAAYRMIAGGLPFGGAGLRHALSEQMREVAPFEEAVARQLEPGVQSFV